MSVEGEVSVEAHTIAAGGTNGSTGVVSLNLALPG